MWEMLSGRSISIPFFGITLIRNWSLPLSSEFRSTEWQGQKRERRLSVWKSCVSISSKEFKCGTIVGLSLATNCDAQSSRDAWMQKTLRYSTGSGGIREKQEHFANCIPTQDIFCTVHRREEKKTPQKLLHLFQPGSQTTQSLLWLHSRTGARALRAMRGLSLQHCIPWSLK